MQDDQSYEDYIWTSQEVKDWAIYLRSGGGGHINARGTLGRNLLDPMLLRAVLQLEDKAVEPVSYSRLVCSFSALAGAGSLSYDADWQLEQVVLIR